MKMYRVVPQTKRGNCLTPTKIMLYTANKLYIPSSSLSFSAKWSFSLPMRFMLLSLRLFSTCNPSISACIDCYKKYNTWNTIRLVYYLGFNALNRRRIELYSITDTIGEFFLTVTVWLQYVPKTAIHKKLTVCF